MKHYRNLWKFSPGAMLIIVDMTDIILGIAVIAAIAVIIVIYLLASKHESW